MRDPSAIRREYGMSKNLLPWAIGIRVPFLERLELAKATGYEGFDPKLGEVRHEGFRSIAQRVSSYFSV